jgi:hypothetical protein
MKNKAQQGKITQGSFSWKDGIVGGEVVFIPTNKKVE